MHNRYKGDNMKKNIVFFALCGLALSVKAFAAEDPVTIAVVDAQGVMQSCDAGREFQRSQEQRHRDEQKKIAELRKSLEEERKKIERQKGLLSQGQLEQRQRSYEQKVQDASRTVNEKAMQMEQIDRRAISLLQNKVRSVIQDVGRKRGFTVVFDQLAVLWQKSNVEDITKEVLLKLNAEFPAIPQTAK